MKHMQDLSDFLLPVDLSTLNEDIAFNDGQLGSHIKVNENEIPDISNANIVLIGIGEMRGSGMQTDENVSLDIIRKQFYRLHYWHTDIVIADLGNIKTGANLTDSYAALKTVIKEVIKLGKTVVILGGSHDITLAQYETYKDLNQIIEATCIDAKIDLKGDSSLRSENFLLDMLTGEPNMVRHYNHIAFQSYFVHPRLLETMDKLRFDCFRVGNVKEDIMEMEPVIRNSNLVSFDISAIKNSAAPSGAISPNGLNGEEACVLAQFAGLSSNVSSFGIYGYTNETDNQELSAKQIAQMIWYFIDGKNKSKREAALDDKNNFNEYHTFFSEVDTVFLQSKKTNRWWMQMPNNSFIACSKRDYDTAKMNDIPERWLRAQERAL